MTDRELDLVVYGATGFVGALTAEQLAAVAPPGLRIGLGGRSAEKLRQVRDRLGARAAEWPLVMADSDDRTAVRALADRTHVVLTTVGPYARHGLPLLGACAQAGTHYADLAGELLFVRRAINEWDATARDTGARIVNACGFDSIPSDLGVLALHEAVVADGAGELTDTTFVLTGARGGLSGGTLASLTGQLAEMKGDAAARRLIADPYALSPDATVEPRLGRESDLGGVSRVAGRWTAPFVMAPYNTRIVRRSNALSGHAYGRQFRYSEVLGLAGGARGLVAAAAVTSGLGVALAGLAVMPAPLLQRVLPQPGSGPAERTRQRGYFTIEIHAGTTSGRRYVAAVAAKGDPGYAATAVMLAESGLALADAATLPLATLPTAAGVLTPATGLGRPLIERLRARGFRLDARAVSDPEA